jgi:hypothetical protein
MICKFLQFDDKNQVCFDFWVGKYIIIRKIKRNIVKQTTKKGNGRKKKKNETVVVFCSNLIQQKLAFHFFFRLFAPKVKKWLNNINVTSWIANPRKMVQIHP